MHVKDSSRLTGTLVNYDRKKFYNIFHSESFNLDIQAFVQHQVSIL
jgi:hypothetical protein